MFPGFWLHDVSCGLSSRITPHTDIYRCFGAASAKERLDVVIRDAINAGDIPGPRYLANGKEMARRDGALVDGITAYADGPEEMRSVIQHHAALGVDNIKLSMSGEEVSSSCLCILDFKQLITMSTRSQKSGLRKTATLPTKRQQPVLMRLTN
jgi:hypothetical protein